MTVKIFNADVIEENNVLRLISLDVNFSEISQDELLMLIDTMSTALRETNGVGIAAPQVGVNLNMFIISISKDSVKNTLEYKLESAEEFPLTIMINPSYEIINDNKFNMNSEGCLSIPGMIGMVKRPNKIKISYIGSDNVLHQNIILEGYNARVFLHEYDHLQGILYKDKCINFCSVPEWVDVVTQKRNSNDINWLNSLGYKK